MRVLKLIYKIKKVVIPVGEYIFSENLQIFDCIFSLIFRCEGEINYYEWKCNLLMIKNKAARI